PSQSSHLESTEVFQTTHTLTKSNLSNIHVLGQLDRKYIICTTFSPTTLLAIDQHAADERVRLESLLCELPDTVRCPPISFCLDEFTTRLVEKHAAWCSTTGVTVIVNDGIVHVSSVPRLLLSQNIEEVVKALVIWREENMIGKVASVLWDAVCLKAC
ncbi:DNA mismatch repair protein, partial [Nowakowskiella sp. JEL0078]